MEQPFYIGQKVVCISDTTEYIIKNEVYLVRDIRYISCCKYWILSVETGKIPIKGECNTNCPKCLKKVKISDKSYWYSHDNFAPLQEGFEAITFERVMEEEKVSVN